MHFGALRIEPGCVSIGFNIPGRCPLQHRSIFGHTCRGICGDTYMK
jgi:hypothetical protein